MIAILEFASIILDYLSAAFFWESGMKLMTIYDHYFAL